MGRNSVFNNYHDKQIPQLIGGVCDLTVGLILLYIMPKDHDIRLIIRLLSLFFLFTSSVLLIYFFEQKTYDNCRTWLQVLMLIIGIIIMIFGVVIGVLSFAFDTPFNIVNGAPEGYVGTLRAIGIPISSVMFVASFLGIWAIPEYLDLDHPAWYIVMSITGSLFLLIGVLVSIYVFIVDEYF